MQVADTNMDTVNMPGEKNVVTGRKVLAWIIAFFGVVFVANGVFLWLALTSFSGIEATSAYKAGLGFEQERAAAAEQNDRGWQVSADIARSGTGADIRIHARDKDGAPIRDVMFLATFKRPAQDREDHALALSQVEPGVYAARLDAIASGQWLLEIQANGVAPSSGDDLRLFRSESRIVLKD